MLAQDMAPTAACKPVGSLGVIVKIICRPPAVGAMKHGQQQDDWAGEASERQPSYDREPTANASRREEVHERETGEQQSD